KCVNQTTYFPKSKTHQYTLLIWFAYAYVALNLCQRIFKTYHEKNTAINNSLKKRQCTGY
ncbi:MAG: hypothetical protein ACOYKR_13365, partial [Sphingobacterium thalpophilum]